MTRRIDSVGVENCLIDVTQNYDVATDEVTYNAIIGDDPALAIEAESPEQLVEFARTFLRTAEEFAHVPALPNGYTVEWSSAGNAWCAWVAGSETVGVYDTRAEAIEACQADLASKDAEVSNG